MQVTIPEAIEHLKLCIKAGLPCMLTGSPGTGKSEISKQVGDFYKLFPIDIRLSQCDPVDMNGLPAFKDGKASYIPMDMWPVAGTPIPKGYNGFLIILDEFNSASLAVQAASYKVVLDRVIGQVPLHPKTAIICIGNLATDNAIVNRLSTAMQSRLIHLELAVDASSWLSDWAIPNKIDHRILTYIQRYPDKLYNFDPDHDDKTFATLRTWYFVHKLLKLTPGDLTPILAPIAGTIGEGIGREFVMFTTIYDELPTFEEIKKNPKVVPINDEPSMLWAVSHMVSSGANKDNMPPLMEFIDRLPVEFATITLQNILRTQKELIKLPCLQEWMRVNGAELF